MQIRDLGPDGQTTLEKLLGYLNFSSGSRDFQFHKNLNRLFEVFESKKSQEKAPTWRLVFDLLEKKVEELRGKSSAFNDCSQVDACIRLVREHVVPGFFTFHRQLLFHQTEASIVGPFFLGQICEVVLSNSTDWDSAQTLTQKSIRQLSDFVGYRPLPVLENQRFDLYPHEKIATIPLYIDGAGVCVSPYKMVVEQALQLLRETEPDILRAACFAPEQLRELSIDPRAYDFEHPVNKRPNYHFGQWDPHAIDNKGNYYRYVIQQVTLNALMQRVAETSRISRRERTMEAAAVLAGTILMASGVSGYGPDTHDSNTSLGNLLPRIATYRDAFYERLIERLETDHHDRLKKEAQRLRQPFGAARQHLNTQLTRRRASQLEHVRLASVFAKMGFPESAQRKIDSVPVTSARMLCQIDCNLAMVQKMIEDAELEPAERLLISCREILLEGIQCGAIIDPWNILAFDGNFSLFPHLENSIHDHRVEQLVDLIDELFEAYSQLWSAAAAANERVLSERISAEFRDFTKWWYQFAVHETSTVQFPDPNKVYSAAESVADALRHWHQGGESVGDIGFWAPYVERFDTPRAYQLVISMLLNRHDYVASRGLLANWLDQADRVPMEQSEPTFQQLATRWLVGILHLDEDSDHEGEIEWDSVRKFFDYIEANSGNYWNVPTFDVESIIGKADSDHDFELEEFEEQESEDDLFGAAYEDVVYRDSTDDGMESSIYDTDSESNEQLDEVYDHIVGRLAFLNGLARLRKMAAIQWTVRKRTEATHEFDDSIVHWWRHIKKCRSDLMDLLRQIHHYRLTQPDSDFLSMAAFDHQRMIRETLLEHVILCSVEMTESSLFILSAMPGSDEKQDILDHLVDEERTTIELIQFVLQRDIYSVRNQLSDLLEILRRKPVLYVPLSRGGNPKTIIEVRNRQQILRLFLAWLPRLGLLTETRELIESVRKIERSVSSGPGAVTEFDDLFEVGYRAMVEGVIRATDVDESKHLSPSTVDDKKETAKLVNCLEQMTESMLVSWLAHSRTLRLSVLEKLKSKDSWEETVAFIQTYGHQIFTQQFLSLANIRAILYQGVDEWFAQLEEHGGAEFEFQLLDELDTNISREDACRILTQILDAVVENYTEYRDYNSTTTQSDRGDLLYNMLDFLRLLCNYERVVWNLKPVVLSHELLIRHGCTEAAQMWRRALAERISEEADRYLERLKELQQNYAMRLSTVADRLGERFLRPMVVDRMRGLVEPAMNGSNPNAFEILEEEATLLMRDPSGVGFDPPQWLIALEEEVQRIRTGRLATDDRLILESALDPEPMTIREVHSQLGDWESGESDLA